jgi:hypothetical protein
MPNNRAEKWMKANGVPTLRDNVEVARQSIGSAIVIIEDLTQDVEAARQNLAVINDFKSNIEKRIITTTNLTSIDCINNISKLFDKAINKLNWTKSLIDNKKDEIITATNYSSVLRPIFDLKYGQVGNKEDFDIWIFTLGNDDELQYFVEQNKDFDNIKASQLPPPFNTLCNELNNKYYEKRINLINQQNQEVYYAWNFVKFVNGIEIGIEIMIPDILNSGKWIVVACPIEITLKLPEIDSYETVPNSFEKYLKNIEDAFNTFSKSSYDSINGTIYQFGSDKQFNILKVVSSSDYPSWIDQLIINSYIPGSNINMPLIIFQINTELNRNYGELKVNEIVIVSYVIGVTYYTGVIKMINIINYGLCYQIINVNINEAVEPSLKINGDVEINGSLNIFNCNNESIISTDNSRKITTFHDKVGINQYYHEVEGLLDIDNLTHQIILDLFDDFIPYQLNSYDVMKTINELPEYSNQTVTDLFENSSLFDYKNQVAVISVPINSNVNDITTINKSIQGADIIGSKDFLKKKDTIILEIKQMAVEITQLNDPLLMFSYMELITDDNQQSYILSMRGIIRNENLIISITYLNVTYLMIDLSYTKILLNIFDYTSREFRYMNYVKLLVTNRAYYDANKVFLSEKFESSIKNNQFFSNKFDLLPESYIFMYDSIKYKYKYIELKKEWNEEIVEDLFSGDNNIKVVVNLIENQLDIKYNYKKRSNGSFPVNYLWFKERKLSFTQLIYVNEEEYVVGSGVNLNSLISKSIIVKGDNEVYGNFHVKDTNNNTIFKVDNVEKTITNAYKVGIGIEEPKSILHIKDTTVQDILDEMLAATKQINTFNNLYKNLKTANEEEFETIIEEELSVQAPDNYFAMYEVNTDTLLGDDMKCHYNWAFPSWKGKIIKNIVDYDNSFILTIVKDFFTNILNIQLIYDFAGYSKVVEFKWGNKQGRGFFIFINNKLYIVATGTNLGTYNIRLTANNNIGSSIAAREITIFLVLELYRKIKTPVSYNIVESQNALNTQMKDNKNIKFKTFKIKIDKISIKDMELSDINVDTLVESNKIQFKDMNSNDQTKYIEFHKYLFNNYNNNISVGDNFMLVYSDLKVDNKSACKCTDVDGNKITLIGVEFVIQDVIIPTLNVEGDTMIKGDLLITDQKTNTNFVSIDPIQKYVGINTDERYIYYDETFTTTSSLYNAEHNVIIKNDHFPVLVSERTQENKDDIKNLDDVTDPSNNLRYFDSYSSANLKRNSELYTFEEMKNFSLENDSRQRDIDNNTVTHTRYGTDLMFEVCDNSGLTKGIGSIKMTIDDIDSDGHIKGGFGVQVEDKTLIIRDLMYVDNSGTLFINKINLGGKVLEVDNSGNLLWDKKMVSLEL